MRGGLRVGRHAPGAREVARSLDRLDAWVRANGLAGSDPYDGLNSPFARLAAPLGRWGRIAFVQALRRSPVDLRGPALVPRTVNPKTVALLALAHLQMLETRADRDHERHARECLGWLESHAVSCGDGIGWGYPFDWAARAFFVPRGLPSVVVSSVAGKAFLEASRVLKERRFVDTARSVADFILTGLRRTETDDGICFSYTPVDSSQVFNASLMGASLLARVGADCGGDSCYLSPARSAARFVLARQSDDGSWVYGSAPFHQWIDGHHTGFLLRDLADILDATGWEELREPLRRGLAFYGNRLIAEDGRPLFRLDKPWPADIHACAEAILSFATLSRFDETGGGLDRARAVAGWTLDNLLRPDGAFGYRKYPRGVDRTAHLRWGQAWMMLAMARLEAALRHEPDANDLP